MKDKSPASLPVGLGQTGKAPYAPPKLSDFGSVTQLTSGPWSGALDSIVGADGGWNPDRDGSFS